MAIKKTVQYILIVIGVLSLAVALLFCSWACFDVKTILQALGVVIAFNFFMYKMLAGWLFINLDVKLETERQKIDDEFDSLAIKITLKKGETDSLWLKDIQIRLSEASFQNDITTYMPFKNVIHPIGIHKNYPEKDDYWVDSRPFDHYVISRKEEVPFAAYIQVKRGVVIAVEALILGTRPFYGIETRDEKLIQWRSSAVVLPV